LSTVRVENGTRMGTHTHTHTHTHAHTHTCALRGATNGRRCRRRHAFDGGIFRVVITF
jgi:hypothetical protein